MNIAQFFIRRPVFAGVLSVLILIVGALSLLRLPVSEYPEVVPPSIVVRAAYPGANARTIAETVAAPLEQAINGVENQMYMFSQAASDGVMTLTVTFQLGTDVDKAQVQVQNRVAQALPRLPEEVRRLGVTTTKQSPDLTMVAHLVSPKGRYDEIYLRNFASLQVKDELARIQGVGDVEIFGAGEFAMRIWLDPDKLAARGMTASDVVDAVRAQNTQVAAGAIGQSPLSSPSAFETQLTTQGRLVSEDEFEKIIVKVGPQGQKTHLSDVARVELGASGYSLRSLLDNQVAIALPIFQSPGANALQLSSDVRAKLAELSKNFPDDLEYRIVYDPTVFVRKSIQAVITTLLEAIALVVIVVIVFLQTWRASLIPLAAVPISLVGTFAAMHAFGFSINALSLFGLVLAIGIVVDDAIVVVENVERNISLGKSPADATAQAMKEVTGPIIATALVLCAVFIPTAFISGLTGRFYEQFAITIAISTVISAFNSLTLSPALSALLLRAHDAPKDRITRVLDFLLGWFFRPFNRLFEMGSHNYSRSVAGAIRHKGFMLAGYLGLVFLTWWAFQKTPTGFVPTQDKQYLVAFTQLPDAASLDRTEAVVRRMGEIAMKHKGVEHTVAFPGLSINGFAAAPNAGIVFIGLEPFEKRSSEELSGAAIAADLNREFSAIQEGFVLAVQPPPVNGMGALGGFKLYVEDKSDLGYDALYGATQGLVGQAWQTPGLTNTFSGFTVNVPELHADIDREKARSQHVQLGQVYDALQMNLGSLYVNDFNRFGRTFQVIVQADSSFRDDPSDIARLQVRNESGGMLPLGTLVQVSEAHGPDRVMRYNGSPAAEISGGPADGYSSGQAEELMANIAKKGLPSGMSFEWTELTYQRILAGNTAAYVYPLCILLVFLVLAAQYESFRMPLAIILIVPLCLLFALVGVWLRHGDNNIFTQIGLIVLVGLACKNAILIVEFARVKQEEGLSAADAAVAAARLRLRPILMTSIAFIAGVYPLVASHGAGSEMRRAMGIAVFSGMIGVTFLGLVLTPVFYAILMRSWNARKAAEKHHRAPLAQTGGVIASLVLAALFLQGCAAHAGPDYRRPELDVPAGFSQSTQTAAPEIPGEHWWTIFGEAELDALEQRAAEHNQDLAAATARVQQARAQTRGARGGLEPSLSFDPSATRSRNSENSAFRIPISHQTSLRVPLDASWEPDVFGGVHSGIEAAQRGEQAQEALLAGARLSVQAEVASLYFAVRAADVEVAALRRTLDLRRQALEIAQSRMDQGTGTELDLARAHAESASTQAELSGATRSRGELARALALLTGTSAAGLEIAERASLPSEPPLVPAGLPGELLERRPDIVAAERVLASRNAQIGVAEAARLPSFRLTAGAGYESNELTDLLDFPSRIWNIGAGITVPIFNGGRLSAEVERAKAAWEESVAAYRQQVLVALREVDDALAATRLLREQSAAQSEALEAARNGAQLARQRFDAGFSGYLDVLDSDRNALALERALAQTEGARFAAAVQLVKALGGGWSSEALPKLAERQ
ncbi:MAG: multidrug efflux RND transporter permease subunit [Planctomycetes bacterium]|nr:multidrug efflux RND transporter permease subunit [Planctomycetota bacterium]